MKYTYFISYFGEGNIFGNKVLTLTSEILTAKDIRNVEKLIKKNLEIETPIAVLFYQILRLELESKPA